MDTMRKNMEELTKALTAEKQETEAERDRALEESRLVAAELDSGQTASTLP